MRKIVASLAALVACASSVWGQPGDPVSQNARQALMEMLFSKTQGTFFKHLPAATKAALEKSGAMPTLQAYSMMATQFQTQGQHIETFESGPIMLAGQDPKTGDRFEITVESDAIHGDVDDIAISFRVYKNGKSQRTPFMPQMTFSMKKEAQLWTVNEISVTIHVPLADTDFLNALTEKMRTPAVTQTSVAPTESGQSVTRTTFLAHSEPLAQPGGSDATVIASVRTILSAEATYAATYPTIGFTCTLSSLDGFGSGQPSERQAMLINSGLASGKKYGFVFTLSACSEPPAASFRLSAVPNENYPGRKAFCADQSRIIRASDDGNPATCFASGTPVQ